MNSSSTFSSSLAAASYSGSSSSVSADPIHPSSSLAAAVSSSGSSNPIHPPLPAASTSGSRFFTESPFSQDLLSWHGRFLESEQACLDLLFGYSEASGMGTKWGNSRRDPSKKRLSMTALCEFGGRQRAGTKYTNLCNCHFRCRFTSVLILRQYMRVNSKLPLAVLLITINLLVRLWVLKS